jgi:hypothetical protein
LKPGAAVGKGRQAIELRCAPGGAAITSIWDFCQFAIKLSDLCQEFASARSHFFSKYQLR